ncbi:formyltetrahydrofolate deformylase [Candidatus Liberibacter asiaticus]|nr:formyltetrahydrofolate deformylase [Candidatus Liberibacter asiaticus]OMH86771.1 formyltetrahydrofolate deformylase [Candidatus Liberibacter asiaticus]
MSSYILTITCPSNEEITSIIPDYLSTQGCNILDISQFNDLDTSKLFMRISFVFNTCMKLFIADFQPIVQQFSLQYSIRNTKEATKTLILVSQPDHCLNDLLYRWNIGTLALNIVGVVSNHTTHKKLVENYQLPFYYLPMTEQNKIESEQKLINIIEKNNVELMILARYMQILSDHLCHKMTGRIINIHHSFLPSFKGANPYKQAYEYGVKIIGATAHYAICELDAGPIIEQDDVRVTHAQTIEDYIAIGKNIEAKVLTKAVNAHIQQRVFINKRKTIVFPAYPNNYFQ